MADKTSFILYLHTRPQWDLLNYEQKGRLIEALYDYVETGKEIESDDGMLIMAFSFIKGQIDRDAEKYTKRCEKNKEIADERERQKRERQSTNVHERTQTCMNETDNDNEYDNDIDNDYRDDINTHCADKPRPARASKRFTPPTVEEVQAYCQERQNGICAQHFIDFYTANGWMQGKGKPIRDWKAAIRTWEQREYQKPVKPPEKTNQPRDSSFDLADFDKLVNRFEGA